MAQTKISREQLDTTISGSSVMSDTSGSEVKHNASGITSGSYNQVEVDIFGHITGGSRIYVSRAIEILLNGSTALTTNDKGYFRIPSIINGYDLTNVAAMCSGSSISGSPVFTVYSGSTSMLTTNITIDEGEYDSSTSSASAVIDVNNDNVTTADQIWVSSSGSNTCGSGVTYAGVELTFQLP